MATVMTVLGEVESSKLGVTLPHEHLQFNLGYELMAEELSAFKDVGGGTLVDVTNRGLRVGRVQDPDGLLLGRASEDDGRFAPTSVHALDRLARDVGINIVAPPDSIGSPSSTVIGLTETASTPSPTCWFATSPKASMGRVSARGSSERSVPRSGTSRQPRNVRFAPPPEHICEPV